MDVWLAKNKKEPGLRPKEEAGTSSNVALFAVRDGPASVTAFRRRTKEEAFLSLFPARKETLLPQLHLPQIFKESQKSLKFQVTFLSLSSNFNVHRHPLFISSPFLSLIPK